jgi:hypothetical protein
MSSDIDPLHDTSWVGTNTANHVNNPTFAPISGTVASNYVLDGVDEYFDAGDDSQFSFGDSSSDSAFSIALWVKINERNSGVQYFAGKGDGTNYEYSLIYNNGFSSIQFNLYDANSSNVVRRYGGLDLSTGVWYHVAATYDGRGGANADQGIKIYINGVRQDDTTFNSGTYVAMHNTTAPLEVGGGLTAVAPLEGSIAKFTLWDVEITAEDALYEFERNVVNFGWLDEIDRNVESGNEFLTDDLVAAYSFEYSGASNDPGYGFAADQSGNHYHGSTFGVNHVVDPSGLFASNRFDGINDTIIHYSPSSDFSFGDGTTDSKFTWTAWINSESLAQSGVILAKWGAGGFTEYFLSLQTDGKIQVHLRDDNHPSTTYFIRAWSSAGSITDNDWYHIVATYDGSSTKEGIKIYINGVEDTDSYEESPIGYVAMHNTSSNFMVGDGGTNLANTEFQGIIDDVRVYKDAEWTAAQVSTYYNLSLNRSGRITESSSSSSSSSIDSSSSSSSIDSSSSSSSSSLDSSSSSSSIDSSSSSSSSSVDSSSSSLSNSSSSSSSSSSISSESSGEIPAFLGSYRNRIRFRIDSSKVDESIHQLPVLLNISGSSGQTGTDLSTIFDELGSNYKKIAATGRDGVTELQVEVVSWDTSAKESEIWVKLPYVRSDEDSLFYFYWDPEVTDNSNVIDPGDATTMWDNYDGVYHFSEASGAVLNSTGGTDGSVIGSVDTQQSGQIGYSYNFGGNEAVDSGQAGFAESSTNMTLEAWINPDTIVDLGGIIFNRGGGDSAGLMVGNSTHDYRLNIPGFALALGNGDGTFLPTASWTHVAATWDSNTGVATIFVNGEPEASSSSAPTSAVDSGTGTLKIGRQDTLSDRYIDGRIDEPRFSNHFTASDAYIKASYNAQSNALVTFEADTIEEESSSSSSIDSSSSSSSESSIEEPEFLPGWNNRFRFETDSNKVSYSTKDVPVLIKLSTSSGANSSDLSFVFDELGANSKKIAITARDGVTEYEVEIESWDESAEEAYLWVKLPYIRSSENTIFYFYYDINKADNANIKSLGESSTIFSDWEIAYHYNNTSSSVINSNSANADGSVANGVTRGVDGQIGNGFQFDGIDDFINTNQVLWDSGVSSISIEAWLYPTAKDDFDVMIWERNTNVMGMQVGNVNDMRLNINSNIVSAPDGSVPNDTWTHVLCTWDNTEGDAKIWVNGELEGTANFGQGSTYGSGAAATYVSHDPSVPERKLTGSMDEARASNSTTFNNKPGYAEISYNSGLDSLIIYGALEDLSSSSSSIDSSLHLLGTMLMSLQQLPNQPALFLNGMTDLATVIIFLKDQESNSPPINQLVLKAYCQLFILMGQRG